MIIITGKQATGKTTLLNQFKQNFNLSDDFTFDEVTDLHFIYELYLEEQKEIDCLINTHYIITTQIPAEDIANFFINRFCFPPRIIQTFCKNRVFSTLDYHQ
ncbi:MAG: hypothetical protein Q4A00_06950 [Flavobacteriaceae bacterium]|nr:hypothetical protein [Flavobacteriaceae bacterium]